MSQRNHVAPVDEELANGSWKAKTETSAHKENKALMAMKEKHEKAEKFDAFYKLLGSKCKPEEKRIDFVLVYKNQNVDDIEDKEDQEEFERQNELREKFEIAIKEEGIQKQKVVIDDKIYTKLHCPFRRLCLEAELVSLEMPLNEVRTVITIVVTLL